MRQLFLVFLLCVVVLLTSAFLETPKASASVYPANRVTVTTLLPGRFGVYFSPTYITCRAGFPCAVVVNRTQRSIRLFDTTGRFWGILSPGTRSQVLFYRFPGRYLFFVRGVRVPLTITVRGDWQQRWGWYGSSPV